MFTESSTSAARNYTTVAIVVCVAATCACARLAQTSNTLPRGLLSEPRPLTNTEIGTILSASRKALTAKTFRLASLPLGQGPEVLMGRAGLPKIVRWAGAIEGGTVGGVVSGSGVASRPAETRWRRQFISIVEYTGRPARHCNGSADEGELVVEYRQGLETQAWTTMARQRQAWDFGGPGIAPIFEMLQGAVPVTSGERRRFRDRSARAFTSPWARPAPSPPPTLTGDPIPNVRGEPAPNEAVQSLWIDIDSLLPLRWEVSEHGLLRFGFDFSYSSIDLRPPAGVPAPECIR